uniref:Uncharacterized protein n=1 Tax=Angiostrongylus cantonensis TaxID=6313 RepID=A0A0K0D5T0_ANGCA
MTSESYFHNSNSEVMRAKCTHWVSELTLRSAQLAMNILTINPLGKRETARLPSNVEHVGDDVDDAKGVRILIDRFDRGVCVPAVPL